MPEAPIVKILKNNIRDDVKQEIKKEMQPFVLLPIYVYLIVSVIALIVSIFRAWAMAISAFSVACLCLDTYFNKKSISEPSVSVQSAPEDEPDVIVDMEAGIQEKQ